MVVLTLSVTFVLNITQAVSKGREFAVLVHALGAEGDYETLRPKLAEVASQFNAFPVALYFSLPQADRRTVPAIRRFIDETLTDPTRLEAMRPIIGTLPGVCADGDVAAVRAEIARWTDRYTLHAPGTED
jgi:hypothetical protein